MANDNQTALMQSIQRKKDRIEFLKPLIKGQHSKRSIRSWEIETEILKDEITEDEKLLAVEEERERSIIDETWRHAYEDEQVPSTATQNEIIRVVNEKYGTDGK